MQLFQNLGHQLLTLFLCEQLRSCHHIHEFQVAQSFGEFEDESLPHQLNQSLYLADDDLKHNDRQVLQQKLVRHLRWKPYGGFHNDREVLLEFQLCEQQLARQLGLAESVAQGLHLFLSACDTHPM